MSLNSRQTTLLVEKCEIKVDVLHAIVAEILKLFPWKYHIHDPNLQRNKITFFSESVRTIDNNNIMRFGTGYLCLTLPSTMVRLYRDHQT